MTSAFDILGALSFAQGVLTVIIAVVFALRASTKQNRENLDRTLKLAEELSDALESMDRLESHKNLFIALFSSVTKNLRSTTADLSTYTVGDRSEFQNYAHCLMPYTGTRCLPVNNTSIKNDQNINGGEADQESSSKSDPTYLNEGYFKQLLFGLKPLAEYYKIKLDTESPTSDVWFPLRLAQLILLHVYTKRRYNKDIGSGLLDISSTMSRTTTQLNLMQLQQSLSNQNTPPAWFVDFKNELKAELVELFQEVNGGRT